MKTLAEIKEMSFVPHHECGICGTMIGWNISPDMPNPYFDSSCDCGCGGGHYSTWEEVFKWFNSVIEEESEEAVQTAWNKEIEPCVIARPYNPNEVVETTIACQTCGKALSIQRGVFPICDDCLIALRNIIKERK